MKKMKEIGYFYQNENWVWDCATFSQLDKSFVISKHLYLPASGYLIKQFDEIFAVS